MARFSLTIRCGVLIPVMAAACTWGVEDEQQRGAAVRLQKQGNFKEAYDGFRDLLLNAPLGDPKSGEDLKNAVECLRRLGRVVEFDELLTSVTARHAKNRHLIAAAARTYQSVDHNGAMIGGEFKRGRHRGRGVKWMSADDRDRVRSLQLFQRALDLSADAAGPEVAQLALDFAAGLSRSRTDGNSWRLQALTDLQSLPDYSPQANYWRHRYGPPRGAPVDAEGNPVIHEVPQSWEAAVSDGQRWRWLLNHAGRKDATRKPEAQMIYARFLHGQFGVRTVAWAVNRDPQTQPKDGPWSVHTLGDSETMAKLATGVKRFRLADDANPIRLCQTIIAAGGSTQIRAYDLLISIYLDRRQYPKAAKWLQHGLLRHAGRRSWRDQLAQIIGKWGIFERGRIQAAGKGATLDFRYRNAAKVRLQARRIKVDRLLADIRSYISSRPPRLDYQKVNIDSVGSRLVQNNEAQYIGETVADWEVGLQPPADHFDDVANINTPLQSTGAYLVTATIPGGNTSRIIVWLTDTAIVKKAVRGKAMYYLADAVTGAPRASARLDLFGYRQERVDRRKYRITTRQHSATTNADGIVLFSPAELSQKDQWLATSTSKKGGLAVHGFSRVWYDNGRRFLYNQNKVYLVTDRPVYRPGQTVKYKLWVRNPRFSGESTDFTDKEFELTFRDGRSQEVFKKTLKADEFGSIAGEFPLTKDATLGQYYVRLRNRSLRVSGGGSFKVEEYRKPEYEVVVDAPKKPAELGAKIPVSINARYYFGSPVTNATARVKVSRTPVTERWYPSGPWDWLYGRGYGWFAVRRSWYPGSVRWCCVPPHPWWGGFRRDPPEVVLDRQVPVADDGTIQIEIDTATAKTLHGDSDHRYQITAEVVDRSRRTIVGQGTVLVSRRPFDVAVWTDRGHYKAGDMIRTHVRAGSLDGLTVDGKAKVKLLRITYDQESRPIETEVAAAELDLADGRSAHRFQAAKPGQYRIACEVTDAQDNKVEGGRMLMVRGGEAAATAEFRFNALELIADKRSYQPGETAELLVNTDQVDSTVLLFVRAENGVCPEPRVVRMRGKSVVTEIRIQDQDLPNFFVEALTIANGRLHSEQKEILVPPQQRVANVEVTSAEADYLPGGEARIKMRLTDLDGQPVRTATVVSVYDKSVEYISGGGNTPDIREFFWKRRRRNFVRSQTNLTRQFYNLLKSREATLRQLGIFGNRVAPITRARGGFGGGRSGGAMAPGAVAADASAEKVEESEAGNDGAAVEPVVRSKFADTAYWTTSLMPNENGEAEIKFELPDDLTTWKVRTWSVGRDSRVGEGHAEFVTRKNLILRMQTPRFMTERDEVVVSAVVHNYLDSAKTTQVSLELDGDEVVAMGSLTKNVEIPSAGEVRVDWRLRVEKPGAPVVRMKAVTNEESDAVEKAVPVLIHGMLKTESWTGSVRPDGKTASFDVTVPEQRRAEETELVIRYSPTLAGAMVDALPYLVHSPHKTTDTTLSRFLPTVIVQRVLQKTGVDLEEVRTKKSNLNAQELGDPEKRAGQWKRFDRNPVYSNDEVNALVKENLQAVIQMQLTDGGWGWFSGWGERSSAYQTALVLRGLLVAKENDVAVPDEVIQRGVAWLKRYEQQQLTRLNNWDRKQKHVPRKQFADNRDALVFMVLTKAGSPDKRMQAYLYRDRVHLSVYAKAMFALALHQVQDQQKLAMVLRNIRQFLVRDDENETAWLRLPREGWWYWYGNETEANAWYLKLLARTNPKDKTTAGLARYLLNNRKHGTYWSSTRDTSLAVEALAEFIIASDEFDPNVSLEIVVDGKVRKSVEINKKNLFTYDDRVRLAGQELSSGRHTVELRKQGNGPIYYSGYLTNFTKEDAITATGLEVKVHREFYRLTPKDKTDQVAGSRGQVVGQRGQKYDRERIVNMAAVRSGDLIEVELVVESKNDYENIVLSDPKAAGFEAVDQTSGYNGNALRAYVEVRDDRVDLYVRSLPRGKRSVSYRVRAETPGQFSAMPTRIYGMYAPELKGNAHEAKIKVTDR